MGLVLKVKVGEAVVIDGKLEITVSDFIGSRAKLHFKDLTNEKISVERVTSEGVVLKKGPK